MSATTMVRRLLHCICLLSAMTHMPAFAGVDGTPSGYILAKFDADWCATCQAWENADPGWAQLQAEAESRGLQVVVFDVTDDDSRLRSAQHAQQLGLSALFEAQQGRTGYALLVDRAQARSLATVSPKRQSFEEQVRMLDHAGHR